MKQKKAKRIVDTWDAVEAHDPEISTERLGAIVADMCGVEYEDVFEALAMRQSVPQPSKA